MNGPRERLAAIAVAWMCGTVDPAAALAALPPELVLDGIDDSDASEDVSEWVSVLHVAARDPRVRVRSHVAERVAHLPHGGTFAAERLIGVLACDPSERVRVAAGKALAEVLLRCAPAERVELLVRWTLSDRFADRAAVARALGERVPVLLSDIAIEQLARDSAPEVRVAAFEAAAARYSELPVTYARIARAGVDDSDARVRDLAHRILRHA